MQLTGKSVFKFVHRASPFNSEPLLRLDGHAGQCSRIRRVIDAAGRFGRPVAF